MNNTGEVRPSVRQHTYTGKLENYERRLLDEQAVVLVFDYLVTLADRRF